MSHIFDALQRSEVERSGIELDATDLPTELLQIAESAAKARTVKTEAVGQIAEEEKPASEPQDVVRDLAEPPTPWDQFEPLAVSLTPDSKLVVVTQKDSLAAE